MDLAKKIGYSVRSYREETLDITQEEAAARCGLDVRVYGNLERGNDFVCSTLGKVIDGLGMKGSDFSDEDE